MALTKVVSDGIATGAVTSDQIAAGAVTTADLEDSGVTAGTYGSSSAIPAITVDAKGRVTSASTSSIDSTAITNGTSNVSVAASGDITVTRAGSTTARFNDLGIDLPDNKKAVFGDGDDLQIYHNGNNSYVQDTGTGHLILAGTELYLNNGGNTQNYFSGIDGGAASLYHAGNAKLATTSGGIDVTGSVTCTGLTINGEVTASNGNGELVLKDSNSTGNAAFQYVRGVDSANSQQWFVGNPDATSNIFLRNEQGGSILFGTSGVNRAELDANGHFQPISNNTFDLGSSSLRWRNVYTNDLNLSNEGGANDVDGTWGSWTIQEGEDELFLLNRRNGKKYKFTLQEVN